MSEWEDLAKDFVVPKPMRKEGQPQCEVITTDGHRCVMHGRFWREGRRVCKRHTNKSFPILRWAP